MVEGKVGVRLLVLVLALGCGGRARDHGGSPGSGASGTDGGANGGAGRSMEEPSGGGGESEEPGLDVGGALGIGNREGRGGALSFGGARATAGAGGTSGSGAPATGGGMNGGGVNGGGTDDGGTEAGGMDTAGMSATCASATDMPAANEDGTFSCREPVAAPSCNAFRQWGDFCGGGLFTYGDLFGDTVSATSFHLTGSVSTYSGFGIYFDACEDLSAYRSVTFTLSGSTLSTEAPDSVLFTVMQNGDEPIDTAGKRGACLGQAGNPCQSPYAEVTLSSMPQTVLFTDLGNGKPEASLEPNQLIGLEWQIAPDTGEAFDVDVTLDDLTFDVAASDAPVTECPIASSSAP